MIEKSKSTYHVTLDEAKQHLHIKEGETDAAEDLYIDSLIKAAHGIAETYIGKDIAETANVLKRLDFSGSEIQVIEGNLISITAIQVKESETPLSNFVTYIHRDKFRVVLDEYVSTDELTINFATGFAADKCPEQIKLAIKIKVADLYDYERASYSLANVKHNAVFETLLNPFVSANIEVEPEN